MQIGVRELRERLSEIVNGNKHVVVTNNGRVVGEFTPAAITAPTAIGPDGARIGSRSAGNGRRARPAGPSG